MYQKNSFFLTIVGTALLLLASCAQIYPSMPEQKTDNSNYPLLLSKIPDSWTLSGRISINSEEENWHARFYWDKQPQQFRLSFTGPFGETYLILEQIKTQSMLKNTLQMKDEIYHNQGNIEELLAEYSGMNIPINSLQYWIFGRYNPAQSYQLKTMPFISPKSTSSVALIEELKQQYWTILFSRYLASDDISDAIYPKKIIAKSGIYTIKVFISKRSFNQQ